MASPYHSLLFTLSVPRERVRFDLAIALRGVALLEWVIRHRQRFIVLMEK